MMLVDKYSGAMEKVTLQLLIDEMEQLCARYDLCRIDMPLIRKIYLEIEEFDKPMINEITFENIIFECLCKEGLYDEAKSYVIMKFELDLEMEKRMKQSETKEEPKDKKTHKLKLFKK